MSPSNVKTIDVRFFRRILAVLVFATVAFISGTVLAVLMGPAFPG
jgi:hypothetical protein